MHLQNVQAVDWVGVFAKSLTCTPSNNELAVKRKRWKLNILHLMYLQNTHTPSLELETRKIQYSGYDTLLFWLSFFLTHHITVSQKIYKYNFFRYSSLVIEIKTYQSIMIFLLPYLILL